METIRKESAHSYEDGVYWDTDIETSKKEDGLYLTIIQETSTDDGNDGIARNEIELTESEMMTLYWHLKSVLGDDNE